MSQTTSDEHDRDPGLQESQSVPEEQWPLPEPDDADQGRIGYGAYARYSPAILGLLIVAVVAVIGWREWQPEDNLQRPGQLVDQPAPDFALELFNGDRVTLEDFEGQAVALNFWGSWCAPCKTEMPALQQVSQELQAEGANAVVLGVGIKNDYDQGARDLIEELEITYRTGRDTAGDDSVRGPIEAAYGVFSYPSTVFIRPDGTVFAFRIGEIDADEIEQYLRGALE
jgi:thiol-disulfide isomerase/thioredoxin